MSSLRHRQATDRTRLAAVIAPGVAVLGVVVALFAASRGVALVAAVVGAVAAVLLGALLTRSLRGTRVVARRTRIEESRAYGQLQQRTLAEHSTFRSHMVERLEATSAALKASRTETATLAAEVVDARRAGASRSSAELAAAAERGEWNELWPDLGDAPTVVDLVVWDERSQPGPADAAETRHTA